MKRATGRRTLSSIFLVPLVATLLCAGSLPVLAATRYVNASSPCPGSGTQANPYCKIQSAICNGVAGDTVSVAPGTYAESLRMRPGVSVISTGGYTVTTIDGTGKPCIAGADFCNPVAGSTQCSVVVFGSGFTTADKLDGFTIRNGKGLVRTAEARIAGGGVFVFSSPTISNNLITGNNMQGSQTVYQGGGIYINGSSPASPVITQNTIDGNRAVPVAGSGNTTTEGSGAGIYSGIGSHPTITRNTIVNNVAADPARIKTVGFGGGILSANIGLPEAVISRNLIAGNNARDYGGGIYLGVYSTADLHPHASVTNNEIRGNRTTTTDPAFPGGAGGISVYYTTARIINNTIVGNSSFQGGGIRVDSGSPTDPVTISNNLITGNTATDTVKGGGGLYVAINLPMTPLTTRNNDFHANVPNQVGGAKTDANVIGVDGNIQVDPQYVNAPGNNYHLNAGSPAIDKGNNTDAAALGVDADGNPRISDGDADGTVVVDIGEFERQGDFDNDGTIDTLDPCPRDALNDQDNDGICAGSAFNPPKTGMNDNCPTISNASQTNTDGDAQGDACDTDDDNDSFADGSDCAPLQPGVHTTPSLVGSSLHFTSKTTLVWKRAYSGNTSNVYRGSIGSHGLAGSYNHTCFEEGSADTSSTDAQNPPIATVRYYLVTGRNRCGESGLGNQSSGAPIPPGTACVLVNRDTDSDGRLDADDNCPVVANSSQADADGDGIGNPCDFDADNDGADDPQDCAPSDPTAFAIPLEVAGLGVRKAPGTEISWQIQDAGSGTRYDLATGLVASLRTSGFGPGSCLVNNRTTSPYTDTRPSPAGGAGYYYMIRAQNACGTSTYGTPARDTHGSTGGACP